MAQLFTVPGGFAGVDVEDRHLPEWGIAVTDSESQRWLDLHAFTPEWLADMRRGRDPSFAHALEDELPERFEIVIEDPSGHVAACVQLVGGRCPAAINAFGVEIGYVVHPSFRQRAVATETLKALAPWVQSTLRVSHAFGSVCNLNVWSAAAFRSAGFKTVLTRSDCVGSADQRRHVCGDQETVFCAGPHP